MVEVAPPDGAEIVGTAVAGSPLAAEVVLSAEECRIINMNRTWSAT